MSRQRLFNKVLDRSSKAFTLVELVIVLVILGILSGIATIVFSQSLLAHKESVAKTNLRVMKSAVQIYRADHNSDYPDKLLSTSGRQDGLDYYLDEALNKAIMNPDEPYKYSLSNEADKLTLTVTGPNSFKEEIIITK